MFKTDFYSVYNEIGSGTRTSLQQLALDKRETTNRPLRIAIDISIWQFQIQSGRGGTNADLRTLFYRLIRLLRLSIQPLFVFDGPNKPPFKRNKRTNVTGGSAFSCIATELFDLFGFPYITAPGEAEAECALLQKEGIVDAVLSEDVDTLMFGCTTHLRNWSAEGRGTTPTHVDVYHANEIKQGKSGLDREGMVLVALMSGGDYIPAGIPNCGPKIACEAARAGFGYELFKINHKDTTALKAWRNKLESELHTNQSKFFRTRHKTLQIPETFPDQAVLYYYIHPVVSNSKQIEKYRQEIQWRPPNIQELRRFTAKAFDWRGSTGQKHFVRCTVPALLVQRLTSGSVRDSYDDIQVQTEAEETLVKSICGRRTDKAEFPELRIAYLPKDIVPLDSEEEIQTHTEVYSGDEGKSETRYDPGKVEKDWFPEKFVKLGVPITVEVWEAETRNLKKTTTKKNRERKKLGGMQKGAIEPYLRAQKPGISPIREKPVFIDPYSLMDNSLTNQVNQAFNTSPKAIPIDRSPSPKVLEKVSTIRKSRAKVTENTNKSSKQNPFSPTGRQAKHNEVQVVEPKKTQVKKTVQDKDVEDLSLIEMTAKTSSTSLTPQKKVSSVLTVTSHNSVISGNIRKIGKNMDDSWNLIEDYDIGYVTPNRPTTKADYIDLTNS
jgi:holliday junction resolvase YEN1